MVIETKTEIVRNSFSTLEDYFRERKKVLAQKQIPLDCYDDFGPWHINELISFKPCYVHIRPLSTKIGTRLADSKSTSRATTHSYSVVASKNDGGFICFGVGST